ncbi:hypothetical protein LSH36_21g04000 [Paralvinella palmiformis]|uniref:CHCH domain-containing protein n=1 Tax=Paralvinella palmiformis TaxID=53620 RepID=A0AAD9KBE3_9ANNE|nr:hypothetical protein LSH36_21g04000 [Paralvinella palmiformis]
MGASSSTPTELNIEEGATSGVVKVSEAVAHRLVGQPDEDEKNIQQETLYVNVSHNDIESEVEKLKSQYDRRLEALEKQNKDLHRIATEEFSTAVEDVEKKFIKIGPQRTMCEELQDKVMNCYRDHPDQSLLCSDTVGAYKACVEEKRDDILTKQDEECQPCMLAQMARGPCGLHFMKAYDCYLEDSDKDECAMLYLEMKECWEKYPSYGYQQIVDRAYSDTPKGKEDENKLEKEAEQENKAASVETKEVQDS